MSTAPVIVNIVVRTAPKAHRGTSNGNQRGGSADRRRRREWLVEPACRCYRCGELLTVDTVTADRIKPGIEGGTYARTNIRPACGKCNSSTGQALSIARRKKAKR